MSTTVGKIIEKYENEFGITGEEKILLTEKIGLIAIVTGKVSKATIAKVLVHIREVAKIDLNETVRENLDDTITTETDDCSEKELQESVNKLKKRST